MDERYDWLALLCYVALLIVLLTALAQDATLLAGR